MQAVVLFISQAKYWKIKIVEISIWKKIHHVKVNLCEVNIWFLIRNHELHIQTMREKHPILPATNMQWLLSKTGTQTPAFGTGNCIPSLKTALIISEKVSTVCDSVISLLVTHHKGLKAYLHKNFYTYIMHMHSRNNLNVQKVKLDHLSWINITWYIINRKSFSHKWMKYWCVTQYEWTLRC